MKLSIIVPLYLNNLSLYPIIKKCLESIPLDHRIELVIVDDASPIDPSDFATQAHIWVTHPENTGYTGAVNTGLEEATGDVLVVMNDDILLQKHDLDRFFELNTIGIYSPKTTDEGTGDRFGSIWGMSRETYKKMGLLKEDLKHFFSDAEYYDRAKQLGIPVTKWYTVVVEHLGGSTYSYVDKEPLYEKDHENYRHSN